MAPTDPHPAERDREFEPRSMTPKRKPLMISTPRSTASDSEATPGGSSSKDHRMPSSASKQRSSWPYPPPPPHDYHRRGGDESHHPGTIFSPGYPDRSMQPPSSHHGSRMDYQYSQQQQQHNSSHRSAEKASRSSSQSIHRSSSTEPAEYPESMEEEMGADYLSLPVGSFAEDSPPRRRTPMKHDDKMKRSPLPSYTPYGAYAHSSHLPPAHHPPPHYYTKSPRGGSSYSSMYSSYPPPPASHPLPASKGGGRSSHPGHPSRRTDHPASAPPPHQHHHYPYHPYPPHHFYPPAYPPHHGDPWTSPQAYDVPPDAAFGGPPVVAAAAGAKDNGDTSSNSSDSNGKSNLKDAFRSSPTGDSPRRPSPPPPPMDGPSTNTTPEKVKMRSPFRSPPLSQTKKSPFHGSPTPLGGYGSFGMLDTPGGTLAAEFSPMGPVLNNPFATGFGEHPTPPQLSLSRSDSDDDLDAEEAAADSNLATSPFSGFIKGFSRLPPKSAEGGLHGVSRSPLMSERRLAQATTSDPRSDRPSTQALTSTQPNDARRSRDPATKLMASPLGHSSGAKPRKLWNGPGDSSGPMRLELGTTPSLKKSLDGINSMMRAGAVPMATPATAGRPPYGQYPPHANYRRLNTPIKLEPSPVQVKAGLATIGNKRGVSTSALKSNRDGKVPRSGGKENVTTPVQKRSPCNCKKSRCLKLYCECFAAEMFCDGCNCADCQNTSAHSHIRDKAIKDTRAKNPNAFKPRITVKGAQGVVAAGASSQSGHNMGCRCKRSECLKKYCECFQAGVMCGSKCKCVDCMNFAGSQKLIDKRRKIKDQRGAELAMKVAEQAWKGPQNSARKLPVARPAVHGMRPMPSPVATPGGRLPMAMPHHMMHPSPSGHPPHYMGRPVHPFMGYSPMGMPPHVSPSAYGMYPPHRPPPTPTPASAQKKSPAGSGTRKPPVSAGKSDKTESPHTRKLSDKETPPKTTPSSQDLNASVTSESPAMQDKGALDDKAHEKEKTETPTATQKSDGIGTTTTHSAVQETPGEKAKATPKSQPSLFEKVIANSKSSSPTIQPTPKEKPNISVHPTPAETIAAGPAKITPMPATPAPSVRLAYKPSDEKQSQQEESRFPYFGKLPKLSETTSLKVFSFLSQSDIDDSAKLVCKHWNHLLARDDKIRKASTNRSK